MNFFPNFPSGSYNNGNMMMENPVGFINDMFNKFNEFDNRIKKLEQRIVRLENESNAANNSYNEPDNSLYMI